MLEKTNFVIANVEWAMVLRYKVMVEWQRVCEYHSVYAGWVG